MAEQYRVGGQYYEAVCEIVRQCECTEARASAALKVHQGKALAESLALDS